MLMPRRLPLSSLLTVLLPSRGLSPRILSPICVRFASRWAPRKSRHNPRALRPTELAEEVDPKDSIEGWAEFKEDLLRKCTTEDEVTMVEELSPQEAVFLMNPDQTAIKTSSALYRRIIPANSNYFSGSPYQEQQLQEVEKMFDKYRHLPKGPSHVWPIRNWKNAGLKNTGKSSSGEHIFDEAGSKATNSGSHMITLMKSLNKVHPVLMPPELKSFLDMFAPLREAPGQGARQIRKLDVYSRSRGSGRRKEARAKVQVLPGNGQVYVNGKLAAEYFTRTKDVENVVWPLQALSALRLHNVWVSVWGGGTTGITLMDELT
jgi:Ribosomal protein S9/S16